MSHETGRQPDSGPHGAATPARQRVRHHFTSHNQVPGDYEKRYPDDSSRAAFSLCISHADRRRWLDIGRVARRDVRNRIRIGIGARAVRLQRGISRRRNKRIVYAAVGRSKRIRARNARRDHTQTKSGNQCQPERYVFERGTGAVGQIHSVQYSLGEGTRYLHAATPKEPAPGQRARASLCRYCL